MSQDLRSAFEKYLTGSDIEFENGAMWAFKEFIAPLIEALERIRDVKVMGLETHEALLADEALAVLKEKLGEK